MRTKTTKAQQETALKELKEFIETRVPILDEKYEIHATRQYNKQGTAQSFRLFTISKSYAILNLSYDIAQALSLSMNKEQTMIHRKGGFTDLAHDTVHHLAQVLDLPIRYVEH